MTQMARNRSIFLRTEMMESLFAQDSNVLTWEFKDSEDQNIFFFVAGFIARTGGSNNEHN